LIVSVEFAEVLPGVTDAGLKAQEDWAGKPLLQLSITAPENVPPCAAILIVYVADWPALTV